MRIENLRVSNFRGISDVEMNNLGSMVIIAGQNGSGKSCIFDAIRLLKSVYGGYQANEWQQWMGEFQINLTNQASDFATMFNDKNKEIRISCDFRLADDERKYVANHAADLLKEKIWRTLLPEAYAWGGIRLAMFANQFRERAPEVEQRAAQELTDLLKELAAPTIRGEFFVAPNGNPGVLNSTALSVIFGIFRPTHIGVIDYHGAQRHYGRENVQGINLNLEANVQQRSQTALYNYAAKYSNVKGEMAASFVKELLAEKAGTNNSHQATLAQTLQELFETFFPEKKFLGPQATADGALTFPVVNQQGNRHDLDELSAGEKEILYGYLRIRNSAPRYSIILLDEPELHLNPRLIRGLPQFYRKNLGEALSNQIWLVSHSDALLREVVGNEGYNVFHMLPCSKVASGDAQIKPLSASADLDLALIDLVGDLAAYRPNGKVVIFEGGGDSDFDQRVVSQLFPEFQETANFISGTNKSRVRALHKILDTASQKGQLPFKFYAITDRDSDSEAATAASVNEFSWNVYHIENYFLEPEFIAEVLTSLELGAGLTSEQIWDELRQCAQDCIPQLIRHQMAEYANSKLIGAINTKTDPKAADIAGVLRDAASRSFEKMKNVFESELNEEALRAVQKSHEDHYTKSIADGSWISEVKGRDILRRFCGKHASTVSYEVFRNLLISRMKAANFRPQGMVEILNRIANS